MGLFIYCHVDFNAVTTEEWEDIYQESWQIIKNFPLPLIDVKTEKRLDEERYTYVTNIIRNKDSKDEHWRTIGDLVSRKRAEGFRLYRHLDCYIDTDNTTNQKNIDILYTDKSDIEYIDSASPTSQIIFSNKTQGYPYHIAILAIALMIENRLPKHAFVQGDLSQGVVKLTVNWLNSFLEKPIAMPVCLDEDKLWQRLQQVYQDDDLTSRRFEVMYLGSQENGFRTIEKYSGKDFLKKYLIDKFQDYHSILQLGAKRIALNILSYCKDIYFLIDIINDIPLKKDKEQEFSLQDLLNVLMDAYITFTPKERMPLTNFDASDNTLMDINEMMGRTIATMFGMPSVVNISLAKKELLDIFCQYQPQYKDKFKTIINNKHEKNKQTIAEIEAIKQKKDKQENTKPAIKEQPKQATTDHISKQKPLPADAEFIMEEAFSQCNKFKDTLSVAQKMGDQLRKMVTQEVLTSWLDTENRENLLAKIYQASSQSGFALSANAWEEIDAEQDIAILKGVLALSSINDNEMTFWNFRIHILETKSLRECLKINLRLDLNP